MTKAKEEAERVRKAYSPRGTRGQKMYNFRMDMENWDYLNQYPNKGRKLNEIIRAYREGNE